jgi:flagellar M-ring protein FliF
MDSTMQYLQIEEEPKEDPAEQTVDRYAMQSEVQAKLRRQVMALLVPVFGPGRVEAQVNVVLNFDDKTTDSKTFLPVVGDTKGIEVSAEKLREQVVNSREPGAEPGVDPNTGIDTYPAVASNEGTYEKIHEKVNYEVSSIYQHIVEAKGKIEKLSVAVVIDSTGMRADFTENVKNLVMNAVGASMENVSVQYMPMQGAQSFAEALEADKAKAGSLSPWLIAAVAGLVVLALALLSYLYVKSRRKAEEAAMQAAALAVQAEEEAAPVEEEEDEFPDISIVKDSSAKEQIGKLIELNPELVANLLRSWLADEQE